MRPGTADPYCGAQVERRRASTASRGQQHSQLLRALVRCGLQASLSCPPRAETHPVVSARIGRQCGAAASRTAGVPPWRAPTSVILCVCCAPDVTTSREQLHVHTRSPAGYCARAAGCVWRDNRPRRCTRRVGRWRGNSAPAESRRASMWRRRRLWRRPLCSRPAPTGHSGV